MKIAIGSDHAGYELKEQVKKILAKLGHEVVDFGTNSKESVDYPRFASRVAKAVSTGQANFGIMIDGEKHEVSAEEEFTLAACAVDLLATARDD